MCHAFAIKNCRLRIGEIRFLAEIESLGQNSDDLPQIGKKLVVQPIAKKV